MDTAIRPSTSYWYRLGFVDVTGREIMSDPVQVTTSVWAAQRTAFIGVGPSPAGGEVVVRFSVPEVRSVRVSVYDAAGRLVRVLSDGQQEKGDHSLTWSGRDAQEKRVGSGVYFVRLTDGRTTETRKIVLRR
jgi:flagellar hook assembly protein FlgD